MRRGANRRRAALAGLGAVLLFLFAVATLSAKPRASRTSYPRSGSPSDPSLTLVTGYCNCGKCCGWEKRGWWLWSKNVHTSGPRKGKVKRVGVTATGARAKHGTIAADPKVHPFGTKLNVPGYGKGVVQDVGGAIKGRHIDVWFPSHAEALRWGRRYLRVTVEE